MPQLLTALADVLGLVSSINMIASVTSVPRDPTPSSDLHRHKSHMWFTFEHSEKCLYILTR